MGKKKLSLWGIQIEPSSKTNEADSRTTEFKFSLKVAKGSPAEPLFYTSPKLRNILEKRPELQGQYTGMISYFGRRNGKTYELSEDISPFDCLDAAEWFDFVGKGIETGIERKVLAELEKRLGKIRVLKKTTNRVRIRPCFAHASMRRRNQVSARGIEVEAGHTYQVTLQQMRSGIETVRKKWRKRFRRK